MGLADRPVGSLSGAGCIIGRRFHLLLEYQHIAIVVRDMDAAYERLRRFKVKPVSVAPQRLPDWNRAAAGIRAFYFRDPDNHSLERIYFPPGKGDPRWQRPTPALFLGIDHTAIAVADTDRSLAFYQNLLGLKVAGESLNYGLEQEYLSHVKGARVRITGLKAPQGPGIEFLEYLTPKDGRPYPPDSRPNDLWHWQIHLKTSGLEVLDGAELPWEASGRPIAVTAIFCAANEVPKGGPAYLYYLVDAVATE